MEEVNSMKTDKLEGMEFCERYVKNLGHQIQTIFWTKEDDEGHQWFQITWIEIVSQIKKRGSKT
jgi:hypothetical protein